MRGAIICLLAAFAVVVLPQIVAAEEAKRPANSGPAVMFQRLDANKDGVIEAAEVPDRCPEHIKQFLIRADRNKDKKLTKEEFAAAVRYAHSRRAPQAKGDSDRRHGHSHHGRPQVKGDSNRRPGPPQAGPRPSMPNPREMFFRMDTNKDKQLSLEEFTKGVMRFHQARAAHFHGRPMPGGPRPPMGMRRPGGPGPPSAVKRPGGPKPPSARGPVSPHAAMAQRISAAGRAMFIKADKNKDGKVTINEVPEQRREGFKRLLEKADKDGDKAISIKEAKGIVDHMRQRMQSAYRPQAAGSPSDRKPMDRKAMEARRAAAKKMFEARKKAMEAKKKAAAEKKAKPEK